MIPLSPGVVKACSRELDILLRACTSLAQQQAAAVQCMQVWEARECTASCPLCMDSVLYSSDLLTQTVRKATLTFVLALSRTDACEARMHALAQALLVAIAPLGWSRSGGSRW